MGETVEGEKALKETILIGGSHCDLGWNLQFIARARHKAHGYKHVVVACEEPFAYLYQDFAHETVTYPVKSGQRDRWLFNGKAPLPPKDIIAKYPGAKLFYPNEDRCKRKAASWVKYGSKNNNAENCFDEWTIFIHARNLPSVRYDKKHGNRTWPDTKWEQFVKCFPKTLIRSIGSMRGAKHIPHTFDAIGMSLQDLCNILAKSKVVVGPSSGPLHLASLCGCPQVVWTHKIKEKSLGGHTNRDRYTSLWNPFGTPVTVLDKWDWNPPVEAVVEAVKAYL